MSGVPQLQRIIRYLLPNILSQILVTAFLDIGNMMISLAGLSFLGLASQPPQPEWGAMLYESKQFMQVAPWMMFFPKALSKHDLTFSPVTFLPFEKE